MVCISLVKISFLLLNSAFDVINSKETVLHSNPDFHIAFTKKIASFIAVTYSRACNNKAGQWYNQ